MLQSNRPNSHSQFALGLLVVLPILLHLPFLLGILSTAPLTFVGQVGEHAAFRQGTPWIDPNNGIKSQALGKLSANLWLSGQVPWWNPYNGVGLPLTAGAQPASLFLPFVLFYHFRSGGLWVDILLLIIAGLSTCAVLHLCGASQAQTDPSCRLYRSYPIRAQRNFRLARLTHQHPGRFPAIAATCSGAFENPYTGAEARRMVMDSASAGVVPLHRLS